MKAILFSENFRGKYTGGRYHALLFALSLANSGIDVFYVTNLMPSFHSDFFGYEAVRRISWIEGENWGKEFLFHEFDFVIGTPYKGLEHASYFARSKQIPLVALFFDTPNWMREYRGEGYDTVDDFWKGTRNALSDASVIIHSTEEGKKYFNEWYSESKATQLIIPPAINSLAADKAPKPKKRDNSILMVGRSAAHKGFQKLVRSLKRVEDQTYLDIFTTQMANGEREAIEAAAQSKGYEVRYFDGSNDADKFKALKRAKVFAAPSCFEGFGLTVAEALYCGTPVVAFDLPVYQEVFGGLVTYAPLKDFEILADKVNKVLNAPDDPTQAEISARFAKRFSFFDYADRCKPVVDLVENVDTAFISNEPEKRSGDLKFSIITPCYNTPEKYLRDMVNSVLDQTYTNWELIIVNDGSNKSTSDLLEHISEKDERIKLFNLKKNSGIPVATKKALEEATGDFIGFLDSDDIAHTNLLASIEKFAEDNPRYRLIYTNEQKIDASGKVFEKVLKPDWNRDFFWQGMFINHFKCFDRKLIKKVGYPRPEYEGSQDYDFILRITEALKDNEIGHIPKILVDWRIHGSNTSSGRAEPQLLAHEFAKKAVRDSMKRVNFKGSLLPTSTAGFYRVYRDVIGKPKVAILILTKDKTQHFKACLDSVQRETVGLDYHVFVMHHHIDDSPGTMANHKIIEANGYTNWEWKEQFNYSKMNNFLLDNIPKGYTHVVLLNDDVIVGPGWLYELLSIVTQDEKVGIVGSQLLYPLKHSLGAPMFFNFSWILNGYRIQHAGVSLVSDIGAIHDYYQFDCNSSAVNFVREVDAVTFACALINIKVLEDGVVLDEKMAIEFNDIDFCMKAKSKGYKIMYTPWSKGFHFESLSRSGLQSDSDALIFRKRWEKQLNTRKQSRERIRECHQGL